MRDIVTESSFSTWLVLLASLFKPKSNALQGFRELEEYLVEGRPESRGGLLEDPQRRLVRRPGRRVAEGAVGRRQLREGRPARVQNRTDSGS